VRSAVWTSLSVDSPDGPDLSSVPPGTVLAGGWFVLALLALLLAGRLTSTTFFLALLAFTACYVRAVHGDFAHALDRPAPLPGEAVAIALAGAAAVGYLVLWVLDLRPPVLLTGEVLRLELKKGRRAPRFLALDEGRTDRTTAWALPCGMAGYVPGSTVRLAVSPATRTVRTVEPVPRPAAARHR
jgi:hypothetical protein